MALAQDLLPVLYDGRGLIGEFGLRPYTVAIRITTFAGGHIGDGAETPVDTPIVEGNGQPPKVRLIDAEQRAVGDIPDGSWQVGPITPDFPGGGTSWSTLTGVGAAAGSSVTYILTGPEFPTGAQFTLHEARSDKTFGYVLILKPLAAK